MPELTTEPGELGQVPLAAGGEFDNVLYRLGLRSALLPGMSNELRIGVVSVRFVAGPVRAQVTSVRQRHALPNRNG
jgi:hypothetical protein